MKMKINNRKLKQAILSTSLLISSTAVLAINETDMQILNQKYNFGESFSPEEGSVEPRAYRSALTLFSENITGLDKCDGDISATISNAFTDGTIKRLMESLKGALKGLVSNPIYLGVIFIQKSNPGFFQMIQDGLSFGFTDFLEGISSCEGMANALVSTTPDGAMKSAGIIDDWMEKKSGTNNFDVNGYVSKKMDNALDSGIQWITGEKAGGSVSTGSKPIRLVRDLTLTGYCVIIGRERDPCFEAESQNSTASPDSPAEKDKMFLKAFPSAAGMVAFASEILGESEIYFCENCTNKNNAPVGTMPEFLRDRNFYRTLLSGLIHTTPGYLTDDQIQNSGWGNTVKITRNHIRILKTLPQEARDTMIGALAEQVAYHSLQYKIQKIGDALMNGGKVEEGNDTLKLEMSKMAMEKYQWARVKHAELMASKGLPKDVLTDLIKLDQINSSGRNTSTQLFN